MKNTINYEPLGNHIVVEMPNVEKETASGIIKVGDTIIPKGQGFMVMVDEIEYFQMNMFDVLGVVK